MTIIVKRRQKKETGVEQAIGVARKISESKMAITQGFLDIAKKKENRLKAAAIRRYVKKHGLHLYRHHHPWTLGAANGEWFAMPAGYYIKVDGVIHNIVAE